MIAFAIGLINPDGIVNPGKTSRPVPPVAVNGLYSRNFDPYAAATSVKSPPRIFAVGTT